MRINFTPQFLQLYDNHEVVTHQLRLEDISPEMIYTSGDEIIIRAPGLEVALTEKKSLEGQFAILAQILIECRYSFRENMHQILLILNRIIELSDYDFSDLLHGHLLDDYLMLVDVYHPGFVEARPRLSFTLDALPLREARENSSASSASASASASSEASPVFTGRDQFGLRSSYELSEIEQFDESVGLSGLSLVGFSSGK